MKQLIVKKSLLSGRLLILIALLVYFSLSSFMCRDRCKKIICVNGDCVDGTCNCIKGFTGLKCDTLSQSFFIGSFKGNQSVRCEIPGPVSEFDDTITIVSGITSEDLIINSKWLPPLTATVEYWPNINILNQEINNITYYGIGRINEDNHNELDIWITAINSVTDDTCYHNINLDRL